MGSPPAGFQFSVTYASTRRRLARVFGSASETPAVAMIFPSTVFTNRPICQTHSFGSPGAPCSSFDPQALHCLFLVISFLWIVPLVNLHLSSLEDPHQLPEQNSFLREVNFTLRTVALLVSDSCLCPMGEVVFVYTVNLKDGRDKAKQWAQCEGGAVHESIWREWQEQKWKRWEGTQEIRKYTEMCCSDCGVCSPAEQPPADTNFRVSLAQQSLD